MYSTPLILAVALAAFDVGQAGKGVDPAVAAARARQEQAKTLVLEFKQTEVEQPGGRSADLDPAMKQAMKLTKTVPDKETVSESNNRLVFDRTKMRFENNHPTWSMVDGKLHENPLVEVDDGETGKRLYPSNKDGPSGSVQGSADRTEFRLTVLLPIFLAFRGADPERCTYPIAVFRPTGGSLPIGKSVCDEYALTRGDVAITAWISSAEDYTVRRLSRLSKGKLFSQIDVDYRRDEKWGWVPVSWAMSDYGRSGDLLRTTRVEVTRLRIGEPQPASEFAINFPAGTRVYSGRGNKRYPIGAGDRTAPEVRGDVPPPGEGFISRHKWLFVSVGLCLLAILMAVFVRKISRKATPQ